MEKVVPGQGQKSAAEPGASTRKSGLPNNIIGQTFPRARAEQINAVAAAMDAQMLQMSTLRHTFDNLILEAGMKPTDAIRALLQMMMDAGMPLTVQNLQRTNQAARLLQSPGLGVFMIKNAIAPTVQNAAALVSMQNGGLAAQLHKMVQNIADMPDGALRTALLQIISDAPVKPTAPVMPPVAADAPAIAPDALQVAADGQNTQATQPAPPTQSPAPAPPTPLQVTPPQLPIPPNITPGPNVLLLHTAQPAAADAPMADAPAQPATPASTAAPQVAADAPPPATPQPSQLAPQMPGTSGSASIPSAPDAAPKPAGLLPPGMIFDFAAKMDAKEFFVHLERVLRNVISHLREEADDSPGGRVRTEASLARTYVELAQTIRTQTFAQIPVQFPHIITTTCLHVYKNKKGSAAHDDEKTALIGLDTLGLGRFEVYVRLSGGSLSCKFRLREDVTSFVGRRMRRLTELLREKNLSLAAVSLIAPGEAFSGFEGPADTVQTIDSPLFDRKA